MKTTAVILAAGNGRRFSEAGAYQTKKQFVLLGDKPVWAWSVDVFENAPSVDAILLVTLQEHQVELLSEIKTRGYSKVKSVIGGGERRQDSVWNALEWISKQALLSDYVYIHDAVRPWLTVDLIERLWVKRAHRAVVPVLPLSDTVKEVLGEEIVRTLNRSTLRRVQTPQLFSFDLLWKAYNTYGEQDVTDDASLIEKLGEKVFVVDGDVRNRKVTTPEDLKSTKQTHPLSQLFQTGLSSYLAAFKRESDFRVGQGIDIHRFKEGNRVVLGGIEIPFEKSLDGHSDADVLTHAICDALLGAMGDLDIGAHFPDSDPTFKGISSLKLLEKVVDRVKQRQCKIRNIDVTIIAEAPRLAPYVAEMKIRLSRPLGISTEDISIKATTAERLGALGRGEGIMATAIVMIGKNI